jgi:hypothetical protein
MLLDFVLLFDKFRSSFIEFYRIAFVSVFRLPQYSRSIVPDRLNVFIKHASKEGGREEDDYEVIHLKSDQIQIFKAIKF